MQEPRGEKVVGVDEIDLLPLTLHMHVHFEHFDISRLFPDLSVHLVSDQIGKILHALGSNSLSLSKYVKDMNLEAWRLHCFALIAGDALGARDGAQINSILSG